MDLILIFAGFLIAAPIAATTAHTCGILGALAFVIGSTMCFFGLILNHQRHQGRK